MFMKQSRYGNIKSRPAGPLRRAILLWITAVSISACTHDFDVRRASGVPPLDPTVAPGVAQQCLQTLRQTPSRFEATPSADHQAARRTATESLLTLYGPTLLTSPRHTLRVPLETNRTLTLRLRRGEGAGGVDPSDYVSLEPADRFIVERVDHFSRTPGEGVPVVGQLHPVLPVDSPETVPVQPVKGFVRALTVVAAVRPRTSSVVTLGLYDPHSAPPGLSADYTTPLALELASFRSQRRGTGGLLRGGDYFASTGLYALETPDPNKTPLVLVHGLISDPADFHHLYNDLMGDDAVRRRFQVWVFYYPTSLPVVYAAMLLREDVDRFIARLDPAGTHPALHRAVLVGHSMGGLLCRLAISEGGDRYYHHYFRSPVDRLSLSVSDRALARRLFYAPGSANVAQVVFIATPQRGSRLASGPLGGFGRTLLHMPSALRQRLHAVFVRNQGALAIKGHLQPSSSLDSLTPNSPAIAALNDLNMRPGVRLHSILGDRGHGGPRQRSSDGVVPYESSHLPQAESEVIVPAGHMGTLKRTETSAEIVRILKL